MLAQLFGFAAIVDSFFIFQQTKRRNMLILTLFASASTFVYNIFHGQSLSVYIGLTITVVSSVISLLQPLFRKPAAEQPTQSESER